MITVNNYFNFLTKNNNIKDNFLKSISVKKFIIIPIDKNNNKKIINFRILNKKILKVGKIQVNFDKKIINLKIFFSNKILYNEKKNIFSTFINSILNSLLIDSLEIKRNIFSEKLTLKGFKKNVKNKFIIFKKVSNNDKIILTAGPSISEKEKYYAYDAAENGWNNNWSNYLTKFENLFSKKLKRKYSLSTSSCTGAMHIALLALNIKAGDEVIVPDITWVSTASVVQAVGAIPVFADVNIDDWTINIDSVKRLISNKTKAIMPVHLYGMPANLEELKKISKKHNLKIIEDAAPAIGSKSKNIIAGGLGEFSAFSFQGAKLLVTGEGGILTTNNKDLYEKAKKIWDFGRNPKKTFWIDDKGLKYKMSNIQAAVGLGQLERLDELILQKRKINQWYKKYLNQKNFKLINEKKDTRSIYWMNCILLNKKIDRQKIIVFLKKNKIDTRPCFPSISSYPIWKKYKKDKLINSKIISNYGLNLPSGVLLKENDIKKISLIVNKFTNSY